MDQQNNYPSSPVQVPRKINVAGMIKGIFVGALFGFIAGLVTSYISWTAFWITMVVFILLFAFMGAKSKTKEEKMTYTSSQFIDNETLTKNQKNAAWVFSIINPIITGAVMYYMWKDKHPAKAKQANNISIIVFLIELVLGIAVLVLKN